MFRVSSTKDILSILPAMIGITPSEQITMVLIKGGTLYGVMSVSVPEDGDGDGAVEILDALIARAKDAEADGAFLAIHTANPSDAHEGAYGIFALGFSVGCMTEGIELKGMAMVTDTFWRDYADPNVERDLNELVGTPLAAALVEAGFNVKPELAGVPEPDRASMTLTLKALEFRATLPELDLGDGDPAHEAALSLAWERWIGVLGTEGDMSEREAADLIGYFQHMTFRDLFILSVMGDELVLTDTMGVLKPILYDPKVEWLPRAKRIVTTLRELLRWTEPAQRPNMLAMAGFMEWFMGRGTAAHMFYDAAKEIEPDHRLTSLLCRVAEVSGLSKVITMPEAAQYASIINA